MKVFPALNLFLVLLLAQGARAAEVESSVVARHLSEVVRFQTVSHENPAEDDYGPMEQLRHYLEKTYPKVHRSLMHEVVNHHALLFTWTGKDPSLKPALIAAHMDVVPIEKDSLEKWSCPPFGGVISDGFVWGRGTMDDKIALISIFESLELLLQEGFQPQRTLYFAFGFDEEVGGEGGAQKIAELLHSRKVKLDSVLDEGNSVLQGIVPDVKSLVAPIGLTEKGSVTVELIARTDAGHSSMPPSESTIGLLGRAVVLLESHQMPAHFTPSTRKTFETLALQMPFFKRLALRNLWLFEPLVLKMMIQQPATAAAVRTTTAPTIISAGMKNNVLPSEGHAYVNFRILPGDTISSVLAHVHQVVSEPRIEIRIVEGSAREAPPEAHTDSDAYRLLSATVQEFYPTATVVPNIVVAGTDGRHYTDLAMGGAGVFHFLPSILAKDDLPRYHGVNERFPVDQLRTAVLFFQQLMRKE